jgi:hypothetical protein
MKKHSIPFVLTGLLAVLGLAGCGGPVRPDYVAVQGGDVDLAVTDVEPPPPQEEVVGVAPGPEYFWIGGVWFWEGGHHVWHPGRWERNRAGYRYVPHHWDHEGNHWHLRGGNWVRG